MKLETPWGKAETFNRQSGYNKAKIYYYAILKDYGGQKKKLVMLKGLPGHRFVHKETRNNTIINPEKLEQNIIRAKGKILEYGLCNPWEMFVTLTISSEKHDRADLPSYYKKFSQYLRNLRKKTGADIKYLFIPELHKDKKNWHMHGLMSGVPANQLKRRDNGYLTWPAYEEKFGFISLDLLRDKQKASSYITKYITKELAFAITDRHAKLYYCSRGLKTADILNQGAFVDKQSNRPGDFENDWAVIRWYGPEEKTEKICQNFL